MRRTGLVVEAPWWRVVLFGAVLFTLVMALPVSLDLVGGSSLGDALPGPGLVAFAGAWIGMFSSTLAGGSLRVGPDRVAFGKFASEQRSDLRLDGLVASRAPLWPLLRRLRISNGAGRISFSTWCFPSGAVEAALAARGVPVEGDPHAGDADRLAAVEARYGVPAVAPPDVASGAAFVPESSRVWATAVWTAPSWAAIAFAVLAPLDVLTGAGLGPIGIGVPAAIGAWRLFMAWAGCGVRLTFCGEALVADPDWPWSARRVYPYAVLRVRRGPLGGLAFASPGEPTTRVHGAWYAPGVLEAAAAERGVVLGGDAARVGV